MAKIPVIWRDKQLNVEMDPSCTIKEFSQLLQELTSVKPETIKLIIPQSASKSSKLINPFSDVHSSLRLQEAGILEGKPIRMMGVFDDEIEEVSENSRRPDLRIIGFDEEEKRLKQRISGRPQFSLRLPQGPYIFCDFRTLDIPGIKLNPPPSEALKRMHMLACDTGIVAIMNKHRWRVGIMTEMAPEGYVGISPTCILGLNKNHGEEISLRLRTDDLKGFRKYEVIKKTLLHELAHMVHSEHDANFFALNKQLNEEADTLDWTKSKGHVLSGRKIFDSYEEEFSLEASNDIVGHKLGGTASSLASARALAGAAAFQRFLDAATRNLEESEDNVHPPVKDHIQDAELDNVAEGSIQKKVHAEPDPDDADLMHIDIARDNSKPISDVTMLEEHSDGSPVDFLEPDPDDAAEHKLVGFLEPDPDDAAEHKLVGFLEPDPDDAGVGDVVRNRDEPDPDDHLDERNICSKGSEHCSIDSVKKVAEPDPDDSEAVEMFGDDPSMHEHNHKELNLDDSVHRAPLESADMLGAESQAQYSRDATLLKSQSDMGNHIDHLDSDELQRIKQPVAALCSRLQRAIETLRSEVAPAEATSAIQTLFKIIRNVIEHPNEEKYRRLRKANPHFQKNVANYKAAMEVLETIGFREDVASDGIGRAETYIVLTRNDPGLLWLAKSSLEVSMA